MISIRKALTSVSCLALAWLAWRWCKVLTARDEQQASEAHAPAAQENDNPQAQDVVLPQVVTTAASANVPALTLASGSEPSEEAWIISMRSGRMSRRLPGDCSLCFLEFEGEGRTSVTFRPANFPAHANATVIGVVAWAG